MPLITVKVFKNELNQKQSEQLIQNITESVLSVTHEKLRSATWVMIEEINDGHWGVAGNALTLNDVKKLIQK
jgi:4-oxalocrotonate tautomerase